MRRYIEVGRFTYEVVRPGCATGSESCPHDQPLTVYRLNDKSLRKFPNLSECIETTESVAAQLRTIAADEYGGEP